MQPFFNDDNDHADDQYHAGDHADDYVDALADVSVVDRPTQLICISDIYLLSWRW